jgi:N-acetylglucosamine malate deacetylase 1
VNSLGRHRVLVFGAHPDDAEFGAGGLLCRHADAGNVIRIVSLTDGAAGHQTLDRSGLAARRRAEAGAAAALLGAEFDVWDNPDGELMVTLPLRRRVIATMREFRPDLVLTHRIHDYHPDHRATAELVRDACYMVRVPGIVPELPALDADPVVAAMVDFFTRPQPFQADVAIDIGDVFERVVQLLDCHASQVYEWLPHVEHVAEPVPAGAAERLEWLRRFVRRRPRAVAKRWGNGAQYAEVFEISEYARRPSDAELGSLFPTGSSRLLKNSADA